ncbi:hypothetical protein B9Z55_002968 [Caenorhabditis nigoni]|uniref:C-type lectin domain-containing protein n=2 Tax=Caenorhabditis nigoni TaxID=1611254 RepID=A0A2G5VMX6_9PELO|nr:hypothetical protein B9Z55_002968 [Caenorhabditis nigoni]
MPNFFGPFNRLSMPATKASLKADDKRRRKQTMLFVVLFAFLLPVSNADQTIAEFKAMNDKDVDESALRTCWIMGGSQIEEVDPGNVEKGHKCTITLRSPTVDNKHAKEQCESRIPFYIIDAKPGQTTSCTYQINLKCETGYWQIKGKCYKLSKAKTIWNESACVKKGLSNPRVADFHHGISNFFADMIKIVDAWVKVPELKDYFENYSDGDQAFYVQQGAYKYDARPGDLLLDDPTHMHHVLCEYTPPMTKAEMYYIGEVYSEIYPIKVYQDGAVLPSASYVTIKQTIPDTKQEGQYTTEHLDEKCLSIGRILNIESYPITAIEGEFNDVRSYLTDHRFYLTNAFKNQGCKGKDYRQYNQDGTSLPIFEGDDKKKNEQVCKAHSFSFHQNDRYPSMSAMRAPVICTLHTFNWNQGECPEPPAWSEPVIKHVRKNGRVFCHYINNREVETQYNANKRCEDYDVGTLTGFDSKEEFLKIVAKLKPVYNGPFMSVDDKHIGDHYWLGASSPCTVECGKEDGGTYVASWEDGVGSGTKFLNDYDHAGGLHDWVTIPDVTQYITFRLDADALHIQ